MRTVRSVIGIVLAVLLASGACWAGGLEDYKAGWVAGKRGNYDQAIDLLTKAIKSGELSNESLGRAYGNRGICWKAKKQYAKAIADYNKAIEISPKNAKTYYNLGNIWLTKKQYDKAIADYNKAIEINPRYARAYGNRGICWKAKKQYADLPPLTRSIF